MLSLKCVVVTQATKPSSPCNSCACGQVPQAGAGWMGGQHHSGYDLVDWLHLPLQADLISPHSYKSVLLGC